MTKYWLFPILLLLFGVKYSNAQTAKKNTPKPVNADGCGCTYLPLCSYTAKQNFGGKTYYGIKGSEKAGVFYNCENGIITKLWIEQEEVYDGEDSYYSSFSNRWVTTVYYDYEDVYYTNPVLNYSLPVGGEWKGRNNEWRYRIIEKNKKLTSEGKTYNLVTVRRYKGEAMSFDEYERRFGSNMYGNNEVFYDNYVYQKAFDETWAAGLGYVRDQDALPFIYAKSLKELSNKYESPGGSAALKRYLMMHLRGVYCTERTDKIAKREIEPDGELFPWEFIRISPQNEVEFIEMSIEDGSRVLYDVCKAEIEFKPFKDYYYAIVKNCKGEVFPCSFYKKENSKYYFMKLGETEYFNPNSEIYKFPSLEEMNKSKAVSEGFKIGNIDLFGEIATGLLGTWVNRGETYIFQPDGTGQWIDEIKANNIRTFRTVHKIKWRVKNNQFYRQIFCEDHAICVYGTEKIEHMGTIAIYPAAKRPYFDHGLFGRFYKQSSVDNLNNKTNSKTENAPTPPKNRQTNETNAPTGSKSGATQNSAQKIKNIERDVKKIGSIIQQVDKISKGIK